MSFSIVSVVYAAVLGVAAACSCAPRPTFPDCEAPIVLYGKALSNNEIGCTLEPDDDPNDGIVPFSPAAQTLSKFQVTAVLKQSAELGLSVGDVVDVRSYVQSATCGYQLQPGSEYLLFPYQSDPPACEKVESGVVNLDVAVCSPHIRNPTKEQVGALSEECGVDVGEPEPSPCQQKCYARCDKRCARNGPFPF